MASGVDAVLTRDGRKYPELMAFNAQRKNPLLPWSSFGTSTGVGSGNINIRTDFNPNSNVGFMPYISLCTVAVRNTVAVLTTAFAITANIAHFERSEAGTLVLGQLTVVAVSATTWDASLSQPVYLGRVRRGTVGRIDAQCLDVNTAVVTVFMTGFMSESPFIAPDYWRI